MPGSAAVRLEYARVSAEIVAPIEDIWRVVSAFGACDRWIAGVETCVLEGEGVGAVRTVGLAGRSVRERLDRLDCAQHAIAYSVLAPHPLPATDVRGTITLRDMGKATEITWTSDAERIDGDVGPLRARIEAFYGASIANLARLVAAQ